MLIGGSSLSTYISSGTTSSLSSLFTTSTDSEESSLESLLLGTSSSTSSSSSLESSLLGTSSSDSSLASSILSAYSHASQFSSTLSSGALAVSYSGVAISEAADKAITEKSSGGVSSSTINEMMDAATNFVNSYNSMLETFDYATSYSDTVSGIEKKLRNAISSNSEGLEKLGISVGSDGTLSIDQEKFQTAAKENPSAFNDLFGSGGSLTQGLESSLSAASDSGSILKSEMSTATKSLIGAEYGYYGSASATFLSNMSIGNMLNSLV